VVVAHYFESQSDHHATVAVDETTVSVEDGGVCVWAAVDVIPSKASTPRCLPADPASTRYCFSRQSRNGVVASQSS